MNDLRVVRSIRSIDIGFIVPRSVLNHKMTVTEVDCVLAECTSIVRVVCDIDGWARHFGRGGANQFVQGRARLWIG